MPTVNARRFDGVDDVVHFPAPTYFGATEYTWATVLKRDIVDAWHGVFSIGPAVGGNPYMVFEFGVDADPGDLLEIVHGPSHMYSLATTHNWAITDPILVAVTWNTVGDISRFHAWDGTTWFHGNYNTTSGGTNNPDDWTGVPTMGLRFGNWDGSFNYFQGLQFVHALNRTTALNDAQIESLAGGNRDTWAPLFDHLWELDQAVVTDDVTDFVGGLDQAGRVGTTVDTFDLPSTIYEFGGGGGGTPDPDDDIFVRVDGAWVASNKVTRVAGAWL